LERSDVLNEWGQIMMNKRVQMCVGSGEDVPKFKEAAIMYVKEVVDHLEEVLRLPVDAYTPPVPPWS
jgi:hypothetical protein